LNTWDQGVFGLREILTEHHRTLYNRLLMRSRGGAVKKLFRSNMPLLPFGAGWITNLDN